MLRNVTKELGRTAGIPPPWAIRNRVGQRAIQQCATVDVRASAHTRRRNFQSDSHGGLRQYHNAAAEKDDVPEPLAYPGAWYSANHLQTTISLQSNPPQEAHQPQHEPRRKILYNESPKDFRSREVGELADAITDRPVNQKMSRPEQTAPLLNQKHSSV